MKKIIIAGHGYFANGIKSSLSIISGDVSNIVTINGFTDECENPQVLIHELMSSEEDYVVLTDVYYGSINQYFIKELQEKDFLLVTGTNLPLAMEVHQLVNRDFEREELENICAMAGQEVKLVQKIAASQSDDADEEL